MLGPACRSSTGECGSNFLRHHGRDTGHHHHNPNQRNACQSQMTKRIAGEGSHARASVDIDEEDVGDDQPLRTLSHEGEVEEVDGFVASHGLDDHVDIFRKAADQLRARYIEAGADSHDLTAAEAKALEGEISHKWRQRPMLYFTIFLCALVSMVQNLARVVLARFSLCNPYRCTSSYFSPFPTRRPKFVCQDSIA